MKNNKKENSEDEYEYYFRHYLMLSEYEWQAGQTYDKVLLTLSTSSIGFSIAVTELIESFIFSKGLLVISWFFWTISIAVQLYSNYLSIKAIKEEQNIIKTAYENNADPEENTTTSGLKKCNKISAMFYLAGVISFLIFCLINLIICQT